MTTTTTLPAPTYDLERARHDLAEFGYCLLAGLLEPGALKATRDRLVAAAREDTEAGVATMEGNNQRIWSLLKRGSEFVDIATHPTALMVAESVLDNRAQNAVMDLSTPRDELPSVLLGSITANIVGPAAVEYLHVDQFYVPEPWPPFPLVCNVAWMLDDFTRANGATNVVPGSHRYGRFPDAPRRDDQTPVEAPAGTAMVFEGRLWHSIGRNTTTDQKRHAILSYYCVPWLRTQENHTVTQYADVAASASPVLRRLMGLDQYGSLGGVRA